MIRASKAFLTATVPKSITITDEDVYNGLIDLDTTKA